MELKHMVEDAKYIEKTLQELCYYSGAYSMRQIVHYLESQLPKQESESRKILRALLGHKA